MGAEHPQHGRSREEEEEEGSPVTCPAWLQHPAPAGKLSLPFQRAPIP